MILRYLYNDICGTYFGHLLIPYSLYLTLFSPPPPFLKIISWLFPLYLRFHLYLPDGECLAFRDPPPKFFYGCSRCIHNQSAVKIICRWRTLDEQRKKTCVNFCSNSVFIEWINQYVCRGGHNTPPLPLFISPDGDTTYTMGFT